MKSPGDSNETAPPAAYTAGRSFLGKENISDLDIRETIHIQQCIYICIMEEAFFMERVLLSLLSYIPTW